MIIGIPRELDAGETRVPVIPDSVKRFTDQGAEVHIEAGLGQSIRIEDSAYEKAGATIVSDRTALLNSADILLRLRKPSLQEVSQLKRGSIHISFLDPFNENELVDAFAAAGITSISMEMIPRTTRAQKMDALSSQASLAGYAMVVLAAERLDKILPMMMTPAGTIFRPASLLLVPALQAYRPLQQPSVWALELMPLILAQWLKNRLNHSAASLLKLI